MKRHGEKGHPREYKRITYSSFAEVSRGDLAVLKVEVGEEKAPVLACFLTRSN